MKFDKDNKPALNPEAVSKIHGQLSFDLSEPDSKDVKIIEAEDDEIWPWDYSELSETTSYLESDYGDIDDEDEEEITDIQKPDDYELTKSEQEHADLISRIAGKCYSKKKKGFTEFDKLNRIEAELKGSPYRRVRSANNHYSLWAQPNFTKYVNKEDVVFLVTSHADNVTNITKPFSEVKKNGWFLKGTYDNLGTNAAATILMKEFPMPKNVLYAFTANEESGACTGVESLVKQLRAIGYTKICGIALDVTWEAHDEGFLYSIENMNNESFVQKLSEVALAMEPETQTVSFTPIDKTYEPNVPKKYKSGSYGMFDEGQKYAQMGVPGCSICLPGDGEMHGNSGMKIRQATFEGYLLSLASVIYSLTGTKQKLVEELKEKRNELAKRNQIMVEYEEAVEKAQKKVSGHAYSASYNGTISFDKMVEEDDPDYDEETEKYARLMEIADEMYQEGYIQFGQTHPKKDIEYLEEQLELIHEEVNECAQYGNYYGNVKNFVKTMIRDFELPKDNGIKKILEATYYMAYPEEYEFEEEEEFDDADVPFSDD